MGLIQAALVAGSNILADQWKEFFYCDALDADVLVVKGQKKISGRSSNRRGGENVISNGSVIAVADGQCMVIVDQGKIVELCAEPGEFVYDSSSEPSIFYGNLGENIVSVFQNLGRRITFGGEPAREQRVYYFNTKELIGNKYGTPSPVPFRVVDERVGLDFDIGIRCFGEYSYRICNPILFYTNVCSNIRDEYKRDQLDSQLKSELLTALQPAFAKISAKGVRYSALPGHTMEIAEALNEVLSSKWRDLRGIEIVSFGVSSVKANEDDEQRIKDMQTLTNPNMAAAHLVGAQAQAMKDAANNAGGAAMGFMGMGMAMNSGGMNAANLFSMGAQQSVAAPAKPVAGGWTCPSCGTQASGKFCPECGSKKPEDGWKCACGAVNKGKFCSECGAKKPSGALLYKCDKCGWEPEDPTNPPKFCPECGDPFTAEDVK